jgi:hypothetical protein
MSTGVNTDTYAYSKLTGFKFFSYNVINYLIDNNEEIWKLLYYNDIDAWDKANTTIAQKRSLIYAGQPDETLYRVFMGEKQINSWINEACILRIFPHSVIPENRTVNTTVMVFDVYCHYRINTMSNYTTRIDSVVEELISTLNGSNIGGLGRLTFNAAIAKSDKVYESGQAPFGGKRITMSTKQN